MSLVVEKNKLTFNQPPFKIIVYKQDIKKIAIFYQYPLNRTDFREIISHGYEEIDNELLAKNTEVPYDYCVILKIITDKKEINGKNPWFAKIIYWLTNALSIHNPLIATSGNRYDSTSVIGRQAISKTLDDLKNNGYNVDYLFPIFHALLDKPTTQEKTDLGLKKHYKKFIALFWIILGIIGILLVYLIIMK
jgi:hypothetical protein